MKISILALRVGFVPLGLSLAGCSGGDLSSSLGLEHYDRPASFGGHELVDGSALRDATYGTNDHEAQSVGGLRSVGTIASDRLDRALVVDHAEALPARLLRLDDTGRLDVGFGAAGAVDLVGTADALATDSSDRILVAGSVLVQPPGQPPAHSRPVAHVARYRADGTLDTDFGANGVALIHAPHADHNSQALRVVEDGFGNVVVFGHLLRPFQLPYVTGRPQETEVFVARLTVDGELDTSFGTGGLARAADPVPSRMGGGAVDAGSRPVVAGFLVPGAFLDPDPTPLAVWRFAVDGAPDASFATDGRFTELDLGSGLPLSSTGTRVLHDSAGRIVVAGNRMTDSRAFTSWNHVLADGKQGSPVFDVAVWRLLPDGSLDASFGTGGRTTVPVASSSAGTLGGDHFDLAVDLALDAAQRPLVAFVSEEPLWEGSTGYYTFQRVRACLLRLNANGQLDPSFLGGAPALIAETTPVGTALDSTGALLVASDASGVRRVVP